MASLSKSCCSLDPTPISKIRIINDDKLLLLLVCIFKFFSSKTIKLVKEFMKIDSQFRNWLVDSVSKIKSTHFHGYHFDAKLGNYERHLTTFSWNLSGKRTLFDGKIGNFIYVLVKYASSTMKQNCLCPKNVFTCRVLSLD